ncbi:hypothetical protein BGZ63DRAFT_411855 [Mariannaea sp. PMI_226]|nr:hypothetical protein BGZ63DRAFT_411855 [Mariannaea sp. PMI_226]
MSLRSSPSVNLPLGHLSSELLALILEQLRDADPPSLRSVRLTSRRLNAIAIPITYRVLTLSESLVALDAEQRYPNAYNHITAYTNHVVIPGNLDPAGINRILLRILRLYSIRWQFVSKDLASDIWLPSDVLNPNNKRFTETMLYVENLPLSEIEIHHPPDRDTKGIPPRFLTSLKLTNPSPTLSTRLGPLKHLLLQASQLRTLHYEDRGQGTKFEFEREERMPRLFHLRLRSYDWQHSAEDVSRHWSFSRLESLQLVSVPVFNFLSSVSFDDLTNLHTLHVDEYSHLSDRRQEATVSLHRLVKNHVRALKVLDITCHTELFPIDAILAHRHSLQHLRFRDHVGFADDHENCPTLSANYVEMLSRNLICVHTLELDMDIKMCTPSDFLRAVCAFPSLHSLTLHVQTIVRPLEDVAPAELDRDYHAAMETFQFLIQNRPQAHWRRITINVGGWRRVMVRRLGEAWHSLNEVGIYAERCFVLERDNTGEVAVREEMCLKNSSRQPSPAP